MIRGFQVNAHGIDLPAESDDFFLIFGDPEPPMNHRLIDFQVKLKAIDVRAITEGLIGAEGRKSQMNSAFGDIERIAVPLKNFLRSLELSEQRIPFRVAGRGNVIPADLFFLVWVNGGAQCFCDQLSAEANPQHGKIPAHGGFDQLHFRDQVGKVIRIVHAHGPAQNDQPMITVQAGLRFGVACEVHIA